jgi:hypothetical protein
MSALGVGPVISSQWLQPITIGLLLLSAGGLLVRARRRAAYGPFILGLTAGIAMYLCKFKLNSDVGVYLSGATLVAAAVWNILPQRRRGKDTQCEC